MLSISLARPGMIFGEMWNHLNLDKTELTKDTFHFYLVKFKSKQCDYMFSKGCPNKTPTKSNLYFVQLNRRAKDEH